MMQHLLKLAVCILAATIVTMVATAVVILAAWPPRWSHLDLVSASAVVGVIYYAAVPLLVLGIISIYRTPTTTLSVLVAVGWLLLIFLIRAKKPWLYYGHFPWWMFKRDFLQALPIPLSFGLAFAVAARKVIGPNKSFKPKPLRGSA